MAVSRGKRPLCSTRYNFRVLVLFLRVHAVQLLARRYCATRVEHVARVLHRSHCRRISDLCRPYRSANADFISTPPCGYLVKAFSPHGHDVDCIFVQNMPVPHLRRCRMRTRKPAIARSNASFLLVSKCSCFITENKQNVQDANRNRCVLR